MASTAHRVFSPVAILWESADSDLEFFWLFLVIRGSKSMTADMQNLLQAGCDVSESGVSFFGLAKICSWGIGFMSATWHRVVFRM